MSCSLTLRLDCGRRMTDERVFGPDDHGATNTRSLSRVRRSDEQVFDLRAEHLYGAAMADLTLTARQRQILEVIEANLRARGYPPSVREIGEAVGLTSPSTVHTHLATLQRLGYLRRDPTKPRAIEVRFDPTSGAIAERRPVRHVPLVGDVAAGTDVLAQENVEEVLPAPGRLHRRGRPVHAPGPGRLDDRRRHPRRRLRRGRASSRPPTRATSSWPASPATRPRSRPSPARAARSCCSPPTPGSTPMVFAPGDVRVFGKVVTVLRRL